MTEFVKQCLYFMNSKAGEKITRPLGETVDGRRPGEVLYFGISYVRDMYVWSSHIAEYGSTVLGCQSCSWSVEKGNPVRA